MDFFLVCLPLKNPLPLLSKSNFFSLLDDLLAIEILEKTNITCGICSGCYGDVDYSDAYGFSSFSPNSVKNSYLLSNFEARSLNALTSQCDIVSSCDAYIDFYKQTSAVEYE